MWIDLFWLALVGSMLLLLKSRILLWRMQRSSAAHTRNLGAAQKEALAAGEALRVLEAKVLSLQDHVAQLQCAMIVEPSQALRERLKEASDQLEKLLLVHRLALQRKSRALGHAQNELQALRDLRLELTAQ